LKAQTESRAQGVRFGEGSVCSRQLTLADLARAAKSKKEQSESYNKLRH